MFDGNHRSRRQMNLGAGGNKGRRRGRASTRPGTGHHHRNSINSLPAFTAAAETTGRETLLEQTRLLREERRRHQLEEKSANKVQKVFRGWKERKLIARETLDDLWNKRKQEGISLPKESFFLSLRLSQYLLPALFPRKSLADQATIVDGWLMEHAATIRHTQQSQQQKEASISPPYAVSFRIVQTTLSRLRTLQSTTANSTSLTEDRFQALFCVLQHYVTAASLLWKRIGGSKGILMLLKSTQECLWWHANNNIPNPDASVPSRVQALWQWSCQAVKELPDNSSLQQSGQALLAATVMGHHTGITKDPTYLWWCQYGTSDTGPYEPYFASLVQHVVQPQTSTDETKAFSGVVAQVLHRRWAIVLANALDWQQAVSQQSSNEKNCLPSTALLQFLHHVLTHHSELAILTSLVARGEDVRSLVLSQQGVHQSSSGIDEDDDDDSSLDQEMEEQTAPLQDGAAGITNNNDTAMSELNNNSANQSSARKEQKSTASRRLSKQELQTMPYLERVYQDEMQRQRNHTLAALMEHAKSNNSANIAYAQSLVDMAIQIGNPSLWIAWGKMVLSQPPQSQGVAMTNDNSAAAPQQVYIQLLARVLRSATGLRARTSAASPFLSQLAFFGGGTMVEELWLAVLAHDGGGEGSSQDLLTCTMLTVFCDVFAHSLVALSDEKFLQHYTNVNASDGSAPKTVMAEHVIGYLRNLLHEVYWTKPVVLDDVKLASSTTTPVSLEDSLRCMRARFLLSGTKLWVSLYERWCRLVRSTPFCDESSWWFPHLASQDGDNAVVNGASARQRNNEDIMDMDIDSDDEANDEMDQSQRGDGTAQPQGMSTADAESDALANSFRDPKMARVLTCIPQALPFDRRVRLFDSLLSADKVKTQDENAEFRQVMINMMRGEEPTSTGRERVEIRRDRLYDDSMRQLNQLGPKLRKKVQVSFVNQHGTQEAGIDGGGVFKEFVQDLIKDGLSLDPKSEDNGTPQFFSVTPLQTLSVNSSLTQDNSLLPHYEFLGRVLGKAVYESILVEPQFCLPFLNQLLGKRNSLEDLKNFDMEYYKNLTKLLVLKESEIESLGLTFEVTLGEGSFMRTVELLPGGRNKQVTKLNVIQYVHLVSHQRLNVEGAVQTRSFLRGFRDLIPAPWVRLFSAYELQKLISGDDSLRGFDIASLQRHMQYAAGYHPSQPIVQWFWEVLEEFTPEQQRKFLRFVTSCSRQPLLGFGSLDPAPCVQQIRLPDHIFEDNMAEVVKKAPLPTSSTCMNLLKLPNYRNKALLRKKLLDAVESGAGFELT